MSFRPRHLVIRFIAPLALKLGWRRPEQVFLEFAQVELDSAWQSLAALPRVRDPQVMNLLFSHAFEEMYHFDLFTRLAQRKSVDLPSQPTTVREPLIQFLGGNQRETVEFLAFLAVGENEIQQDFKVYQNTMRDPDVRALFSHVNEDETLHASVAGGALRELARQADVSLFWVRLRHLASLSYKRYLSFITVVGTFPLQLLFGMIYCVLGVTFVGQARDRMADARSRQFAFLIDQQRVLDEKLRQLR